jgi:hypothetical protein
LSTDNKDVPNKDYYNIVMSSIKNDPRNYPPEPGSGKEDIPNDPNSSTNSIEMIFLHLNIDYTFLLLQTMNKIKNNNRQYLLQ